MCLAVSVQLTLCEQVKGYLGRFATEDKSAGAETAAAAEIKPLEGMTLFSRKKVSQCPLSCSFPPI